MRLRYGHQARTILPKQLAIPLLELSKKTSIKTFLIGESLLKDLDNNSIFSVL